ncbi:MAG: response regulator [Treponemataceae bacterium]
MKGSVLIVDDEKNIRLMIGKVLEGLGLEITAAVNGDEALAIAEKRNFDLVLLDLRMPGTDGMEVLRRLRAASTETKVAIITAHGTVDNAVEAMKLGAVDFIRKPFTVDELRRIVTDALERRGNFFQRLDSKKTAAAPNIPATKPEGNYKHCIQQAKAALEKGLADEAELWAEQSIALEPLKAEGFTLLGSIMEIRGKKGKAQNCFRAAIALDPTEENAWKNLDRSVGRGRNGDGK